MGNRPVGTTQAVLPPYSCREEETVTPAEGMGGTLRRTEAADQGVACLIGKNLSARFAPASPLMLKRRMKSKWTSPRTWKNRTKFFAQKACRSTKRFSERSHRLLIGRICSVKSTPLALQRTL